MLQPWCTDKEFNLFSDSCTVQIIMIEEINILARETFKFKCKINII